METKIKRARQIIDDADALLITAGAGMGVDSGLPDFRGNSGFWKAYPPIAKLGKSFSQMANPQWFVENPRLAWAFYGHRLNLYRQTVPHNGFNMLLEVGKRKKYGYFVFTSNVDGQFQKAGFDDTSIEECHGSIHHFQCIKPCSHNIWNAADEKVNVDLDLFEATGELPRCPKCGGMARPNILMFGDWNWLSERSNRQSARMQNWISNILGSNAKLAIVEMGAGSSIPTVRMQSERIASYQNATLIRINPREHDVPEGNIGLDMAAKKALELIIGF